MQQWVIQSNLILYLTMFPDYFHNTMNLPFFARKNGPAAKRDHFATDPTYQSN